MPSYMATNTSGMTTRPANHTIVTTNLEKPTRPLKNIHPHEVGEDIDRDIGQAEGMFPLALIAINLATGADNCWKRNRNAPHAPVMASRTKSSGPKTKEKDTTKDTEQVKSAPVLTHSIQSPCSNLDPRYKVFVMTGKVASSQTDTLHQVVVLRDTGAV